MKLENIENKINNTKTIENKINNTKTIENSCGSLKPEKLQFGCMDIETGEWSQGYMDNGEMKFKENPWYKKLYHCLFVGPPRETESIRTTIFETRFVFSSKTNIIHVAVYREFIPHTNKTYSIYGKYTQYGQEETVQYDINAFEKFNQLVTVNYS